MSESELVGMSHSSKRRKTSSMHRPQESAMTAGQVFAREECAICLGQCRNPTLLDCCSHIFCLQPCLVEWTAIGSATCPLCKQSFKVVLHDVHDEHVFQRSTVSELLSMRQSNSDREHGDIKHDSKSERTEAELSSTRRTHQNDSWVALAEDINDHDDVYAGSASSSVHHGKEQTSGFSAAASLSHPASGTLEFRALIYRLRAKVNPPRQFESLREAAQINRCLIPDVAPNIPRDSSRRKAIEKKHLSRLEPWLDRELRAVTELKDVDIVREVIKARLCRARTVEEFVDGVRPFLFHNADHFVHELLCFLYAPGMQLASWDARARAAYPALQSRGLEHSWNADVRRAAVSVSSKQTTHASSQSLHESVGHPSTIDLTETSKPTTASSASVKASETHPDIVDLTDTEPTGTH